MWIHSFAFCLNLFTLPYAAFCFCSLLNLLHFCILVSVCIILTHSWYYNIILSYLSLHFGHYVLYFYHLKSNSYILKHALVTVCPNIIAFFYFLLSWIQLPLFISHLFILFSIWFSKALVLLILLHNIVFSCFHVLDFHLCLFSSVYTQMFTNTHTPSSRNNIFRAFLLTSSF